MEIEELAFIVRQAERRAAENVARFQLDSPCDDCELERRIAERRALQESE